GAVQWRVRAWAADTSGGPPRRLGRYAPPPARRGALSVAPPRSPQARHQRSPGGGSPPPKCPAPPPPSPTPPARQPSRARPPSESSDLRASDLTWTSAPDFAALVAQPPPAPQRQR